MFFLPSGDASGLGAGVYLTRSTQKAEFYKGNKWGVVIKVRAAKKPLGEEAVANPASHLDTEAN